MRGEGTGELRQEVTQVLLRPWRNLLEVDGQPLKLVRLEKQDDVIDARHPRRRVGEQSREARPIPFSLHCILDHGKYGNVRFRLLDELQHPIVDIGFELEVRTLEAEPARDHPIEMGKRTLQRRIAVVIPVDVKADAQRPLLRSSERRRKRVTVHDLGLGMARTQVPLPLPQVRSELGSGLKQFGIGGVAVGNGMRRRAGGRPGAADRGMGGELLVEALVLRPMHDHQDRRECHDDDRAEGAHYPRKRLEKARTFAGRVEEDRLAKHGGPHRQG